MFTTSSSSSGGSRFCAKSGSVQQLAAAICVGALALSLVGFVGAQPSSKLPLANEIDDGKSTTAAMLAQKESEQQAEQSFRKFIDSDSTKDGSTVIGEIKSNASALEMMLLRNKIANSILSMQEKEKQRAAATMSLNNISTDHHSMLSTLKPQQQQQAECYIEVTRVEKIPGKCQRVKGGQPICQSDRLMSLSSDCS